MAKYHVEVSGALSLKQIQNALNGEEALVNTFLGARMWVSAKGTLTNLVEFDELKDVPDPQPGLLKLSASALDGLTPIWTGPMVVVSSAKNVWIYRA